jgi:membrane protease YdiL (CAAX protease family)
MLLQDAPVPAAMAEVGAILAATSLALAPVAIALVRRIFPGRNVFFARWGFSHVAQVVGMGIVLLAVSGMLLGRGAVPATGESSLFDLLLTAGVLLACCGLVAFFARRLDPSGLLCLGLWPGRHLRGAIAGLAGYGMLLPGILGIGLLWPWFLDEVGASYEPQLVLEKMRLLAPGDRLFAILLGVAVLPLFEEILFRGFLQPLLVQNLSDTLGVVATSLVFAALHGTGAFLPIFVLSLVLGGIMLRTQRLFAVWIVHALHNGLMFLLLYHA